MAGETERDGQGWKRFQKLSFDKKKTLRRLRRAEVASVRHAHKFVLKRWRNARNVRGIVIAWLLAVGCLITAAGLQLFWDQQTYRTTTGASGGTYAEAAIGPVNTLNPLFADTPAAEAVSQLMFSRILTYDETGNLSYDLAKRIQVSDDQLSYTVQLRPDAQWHDGHAVTSDDVVFTVGLLKDPETRTQIRGWDDVSVTKKGEYTVVFTLKSVYAPFESALTFPIVPKHILGNIAHGAIREHSFSNEPVGSGPFMFRLLQSFDTSDKKIVHLAANEKYYRGSPKISRFQVLVVPDEAAILTALKLNEVNGAADVSNDLVEHLPEGRYRSVTRPMQAGVYAFLNNDSDILSDKAVRQALQRATNTSEIRRKVGGGVRPLDIPYTSMQIYGEVPSAPKTNADAARKLLDAAGWKLEGNVRKKDGKELRLSVVTAKNSDYERALETLIGQWRQIGVAVDEKVIDAADPMQGFVQSTLQSRSYDVLLYQIVMGRDPDVFEYWHSSRAVARGLNLSNYSSPVADDILLSARASKSDALRNAKHLAFTKQWLEDAPAIGLYQVASHAVFGRSVSGMIENTPLVGSAQSYNEARYWQVGERTVYKTP